MPNFKVAVRDLSNIYNRFISLGHGIKKTGLGMHGLTYAVDDIYDEYIKTSNKETWDGKDFISLAKDKDACNYILHFACETNGELAYRAFENESKKTGLDLVHLAEPNRNVRTTFDDIITGPRRLHNSPFWTGEMNNGRAYSSYVMNNESRIPWRTLTGRQHFYLDHEAYIAYGENLPTHKPRVDAMTAGDIIKSPTENGIVLNYSTAHGKWGIHSTYGDLVRMKTLSRGVEPLWMNDKDAKDAGLVDNDWVEVFNDHGVVATRLNVSARIPRGLTFIYHSPERTLSVPKSPERNHKRAGGHNSLTRVRLKPLFMIGGYAQFTYAFNYWGPTGINRDTHVVIKKLNNPKF